MILVREVIPKHVYRETLSDIQDRTDISCPQLFGRRCKTLVLACYSRLRDRLIQRKLRKPGKITKIK